MSCDYRINIGGAERALEDADAQWVQQTINARKRDGLETCVSITLKNPHLNVYLAMPCCAGRGGGGRRPNGSEQEVIDLWHKFELSESCENVHRVWPFLTQLRHVLGVRAC
ncbi:MAG: hypothetical protein H6718_07725 [Polyangiaceae bacterium]|nr:hypothetical protein [Myxococcales bacterium]MCB9585270.1 hypothetical protein [Polyangiaceae bacterium]